jgi:hypothetical protein
MHYCNALACHHYTDHLPKNDCCIICGFCEQSGRCAITNMRVMRMLSHQLRMKAVRLSHPTRNEERRRTEQACKVRKCQSTDAIPAIFQVTREARAHFDCPSLPGMPIEGTSMREIANLGGEYPDGPAADSVIPVDLTIPDGMFCTNITEKTRRSYSKEINCQWYIVRRNYCWEGRETAPTPLLIPARVEGICHFMQRRIIARMYSSIILKCLCDIPHYSSVI